MIDIKQNNIIPWRTTDIKNNTHYYEIINQNIYIYNIFQSRQFFKNKVQLYK